ncbi:hypothetical protein V9T40_008366 [Parthenolecanium corni]|uniref:Uncharacterized protein n=1 Tax=Parthenolecanium corni TaxID=536013 RepID=A0AAN9TQG4_9HEMI
MNGVQPAMVAEEETSDGDGAAKKSTQRRISTERKRNAGRLLTGNVFRLELELVLAGGTVAGQLCPSTESTDETLKVT